MPAAQQEIWSIDSEWGYQPGRTDEESAWEPVVLCAVGLHSGQRRYFWGRDRRLRDFFADHAGDIFLSHYAIAEMKYLSRFGIPLPKHWFDTYSAWRFLHNAPDQLEAGLSYALHQLGLPHLAPAAKHELQDKILALDFDAGDEAARQQIIDYCFSDCNGCLNLYRQINVAQVSGMMGHWVEYLKAVARMELRGIPFDVTTYDLIGQHRDRICQFLIAGVNQIWPVYQDGQFCQAALLQWCRSVRIRWPSKRSNRTGKLYHPFDQDTFKEMEGRHPFIGEIRQVRKTLASFEKRSLVVDRQRKRHYFSTSVFRSVTSRNQPTNFIFGGPKWMRYLMAAELPDDVLVYVDYIAQEFGLAAGLSGDANMRAVYMASDCHMAFAIRAGAAPQGANKATHPEVRDRHKAVNLGVQYGQTSYGISEGLGISQKQAKALRDEHHSLFSTYWYWSEDLVQASYDRGWIATPCGWRSRVLPGSNRRTWQNFPMQATGSDIMRLTVTYLDQQNVQLLAPVHDGFLLTCRRNEIEDLREAVKIACETAIEQVIPGFPLRWDFTVYEHRFADEKGLPLWKRLQSLLGRISPP